MKPVLVGEVKKWLHLSCAYWVPEVSFKNPRTKELTLEGINTMRLQHTCSLCGLKGGACIPCGKSSCDIFFHVECGRRTNLYTESFVNKSKEGIYKMYCRKHRPVKTLRELDVNKRKAREDVVMFCKALDAISKPIPIKVLKKKQRVFSKLDRAHLFDNVRKTCMKMEGLSLLLEKPEVEGNNYKLLPTFFKTKYSDILRKTFPWSTIAFSKFSALDCRREFFHTITNDSSFQSKIMRRHKENTGRTRSSLRLDKTLYCICKKPYHEDRSTMIGSLGVKLNRMWR
jgi:hypothetical protein